MRHAMILIMLAVLASTFTGKVIAETQVIEGVYRPNLTRYTEAGKKAPEKLTGVTDEEIAGTPVIATTGRGLVKIHFRGEDMWLRASALKLSVPLIPGCPKSAPGRSADRTAPTSSGMGASCE